MAMSNDKDDVANCCTPPTGRNGDCLADSTDGGKSEYVGKSREASEISNDQQASSNSEKNEEAIEIPAVRIPGGTAYRGTDHPMIPLDEEAPYRSQSIEPFAMMQTTVTNRMFAAFIDDTGYKTEAERFGWSFVFQDGVPASNKDTESVVGTHWWLKVPGAYWRLVNGKGSENDNQDDHPVVHVSWNDANAFATWAGGRLPTEAEWEHAARGGLGDVAFPWGMREPDDLGFQPCNIWQGQFPESNTCQDGFASTAPAKAFDANGYGLYNMCGNVWEWTSGRFKIESRTPEAKRHAKSMKGSKILKGGSFLCHKSYCFRYRIAARTGTTPDSTTSHQGFRVVF